MHHESLEQIMAAEGRRNDWLARRIGAHESQVSRWVSRKVMPSPANQKKIARALGRTVEEIDFSRRERLASNVH